MRRPNGFTLLEILAAITIIGILLSVVFVSFSDSRAQARDNERRATLQALALALEAYRAEAGQFPETLEELLPDYAREVPSLQGADGEEGFHYRREADRFILMYLGAESILIQDATDRFACPSNQNSGPCAVTNFTGGSPPANVYAVYSAGVDRTAW